MTASSRVAGALRDQVVGLQNQAGTLAARLRESNDELRLAVAERLQNCVCLPLRAALARPPSDEMPSDGSSAGGSWEEQLWELAKSATRLCTTPGVPLELLEATAGLQDLAGILAAPDYPEGVAARMGELADLQQGLAPAIRVERDGPYLVTGVENVCTYLGERIPIRPQTALCLCGQSKIRPLCDGVCHLVGFQGDKDRARVPDRRDTYIGQQVTVLDNRGICQHSGYCTDRLSSVFHLGEEPFVTPSGGRMDEIIRAVRDCPSGALSYAMDAVEAREQVDYSGQREPAIEVSKDGPYRITGGIPLLDGDGEEVPSNDGSSREHYALCRCGHSQNKPFCSGMHWYIDFRDPVRDPERTPTLFEWAGGLPALTRLTRLFYEKYVPADPVLGPIFANMSADHPQRVAKWLGEVFGGPASYSAEYGGYTRMISEHVGRCLTEEWRARWVSLLLQSAQEAGLPNDPEFRSAFGSYLEWGSRLAVENSQSTARPPEQMPMPHWDWGTAGPPGGRITALATAAAAADEPPVVLPAADEPVRFAMHIKPLFRSGDRQSMTFAFDLWAYDDVCTHAEVILARLSNGTMPCDGAWPAEKIDVFRRWVETGTSA